MTQSRLLGQRLSPHRAWLLAAAALCAGLLACPPAHAQTGQKIAVIDLKKVFDGYYKTKQADALIKERASDFDKARKGLIDDYQKANEEYRTLMESIDDRAISNEERDRRKKNAEAKLVEIKELESTITRTDRSARETLAEQQRRHRENILRDIRALITAKARKEGYSLVLDTAAESINSTPIILHAAGDFDMTEDILKELNKDAPASVLNSLNTPQTSANPNESGKR
jgi:Skp family chaperone for outer membrane proteins